MTGNPSAESAHIYNDILSVTYAAEQSSPTYDVENVVQYRMSGTVGWTTLEPGQQGRRKRSLSTSGAINFAMNTLYEVRMFALLRHLVDQTVVIGDYSEIISTETGCGETHGTQGRLR